MKIWMFNNTCSLPEHGHHTRQYYLGLHLAKKGHAPVVFAGSHPHNSKLQLIEGPERFTRYQSEPFPWMLVKTCNYEGSRLKRVWSMFQYYRNGLRACRGMEKPDYIIGSSPQPLAPLVAIRAAKRFGCKSVVEIRDLWPESIVAYGIAGAGNPLVKMLRRYEKWMYTKADAIIFTMEGGADYIVDQGWDKAHGGPVDTGKVFYVNNGVDLDEFEKNRKMYKLKDEDLEDDTFKIIYTGSVRKANNIGSLLDVAKKVRNPKIKFLIWGTGTDLEEIQARIIDEKIDNVSAKGFVEKKYIPYITSRANLTVLNYEMHDIWKYGGSQNKLFEYFAAGHPVMTNIRMGYDLIDRYNCGFHISYDDPEEAARRIEELATLPADEYETLCQNALKAAKDYDFSNLADLLIEGLERI